MFRPTLLLLIALIALTFSGEAQGQNARSGDSPYAARRDRLATLVDFAPVIIPGAYRIRAGGDGRQDATFYYMTGVQSPFSVLVMVPEQAPDGRTEMREILFLPEAFQFAGAQYPQDDPRFRYAAWNRTIERLSPGEEALQATGVDETYPIDELAQRLPDLVGAAQTVYFAEETGQLYVPPGLGTALTYRQQLQLGIQGALPGRVIEDVTPMVSRMRLVKDAHEIELLREAARISVEGLLAAMREIRPGMTELGVAGVMERVWKEEGSPKASFSPIVASGQAAMSLYTLRSEAYSPLSKVMEEGEMVFIDYGAAEYEMYHSDLCRTYPVSGVFSDEQRRIYNIVLEAQKAAIATVRPGISMREVIQAAAQVFLDHGLDAEENLAVRPVEEAWGLMPSPTYWIINDGPLTNYSGARGRGIRDVGHHIGLQTTESRDYTVPLAAGMVFTIEPKIYVPELGMTIMLEDMILVTEDGYENLSAGAPREIDEIEAIMGGRR